MVEFFRERMKMKCDREREREGEGGKEEERHSSDHCEVIDVMRDAM